MRNRPIPKIAEDQKSFVRSLVLYEDEIVLAFNKPSGLAVQTRGNRGTSLDHLLWTFARSNGKRPQLVHRIDAGTSGLILAGKTKPAIAALSTEFAERRVQKRYLALVSGDLPAEDEGVCDIPLLKKERSVIPGQVGAGADAARTVVAGAKPVRRLRPDRSATGNGAHASDPCPPRSDGLSDPWRRYLWSPRRRSGAADAACVWVGDCTSRQKETGARGASSS
jgi:hypothetical protein